MKNDMLKLLLFNLYWYPFLPTFLIFFIGIFFFQYFAARLLAKFFNLKELSRKRELYLRRVMVAVTDVNSSCAQ